jgi:hypothetical protein
LFSPLVVYADVVFVIAPLIGHVTDAVANSPTVPFSGVHSEISAENA